MRPAISAAVFLCALLCGAVSAAITFTAQPDRVRLAPGETFNLTVTISSDKGLGGLQAPGVPPGDGYSVLRVTGPSRSSSIQIVNGAMSKSEQLTYFYTVAAKQAGSFTFPALQIVVDGQTYATQPFTVTVSTEQVQSADVVVRVSIAKKQLFVGQQTMMTVLVGQKPNAPVQFTNEGLGALVQSLEKAMGTDFAMVRLFGDRLGRSNEMIDGESYSALRLNYAVFPLNSGTFTVPPIPFEYQELRRVSRRSIDPFDDFFGGGFFGGGVQAQSRTTASNRLQVTVRSLPPAPAGFSGAVGHFTLKGSADPLQVPAGEGVTYKILLSGDTRANSLGDVNLTPVANLDVFPPEKQSRNDTTGRGIVGQKSCKYLLIPRQEGTMTIPPVTWTYFDPDAQAYRTLETAPVVLTVTRGKEGAAKQQTRYLTQEDIREVGSDIRYIKTPAKLTIQVEKPYRSVVFLLLYPLPFLIVLFALLYRVQSVRRGRDVVVNLRRRALARALRDIRAMEKNAGTQAVAEFLSALMDVVERYITHKFSFPAQGKTMDELKSALGEWGAREETVAQLARFVEDADAMRFGGISAEPASKTAMLKKAQELVIALDAETKRK